MPRPLDMLVSFCQDFYTLLIHSRDLKNWLHNFLTTKYTVDLLDAFFYDALFLNDLLVFVKNVLQ